MKKIIFLADLYSKDYAGGAELTTDAIISYAPKSIEIEKKYCQNLTEKDVLENKNADWIICNFSSLKDELKILLCKNINYSIIDNNVPLSEKVFSEILNLFQNILKTKKKIYIHCKGGHGRSSLLVAALLCHLHFYTPYKALHFTKSYHEKRNNLKDKYRGKPCPQLYHQRKFVIDLFKNRAKIKFN